MSVPVVDQLEVVQVDEQQRYRTIAQPPVNLLVQVLVELAPVVQAGERIGDRHIKQFQVGFFQALFVRNQDLGTLPDQQFESAIKRIAGAGRIGGEDHGGGNLYAGQLRAFVPFQDCLIGFLNREITQLITVLIDHRR